MLRERRILISIGVAAVLVVATVVALLLTGDDGEPPVADETEPTPPTTTIEPTTTSSEEASLEGPVEGPLTLDGEDGLVIEGISPASDPIDGAFLQMDVTSVVAR